MPIRVVVEDYEGTEIASLQDPTNSLHRVLPADEEDGYQCLNYVDWYGDTTFNRYQVPQVIRELKALANSRKGEDELQMIQKLEAMAMQALSEPHLYLKFYGD